jgi:hypothetical protein
MRLDDEKLKKAMEEFNATVNADDTYARLARKLYEPFMRQIMDDYPVEMTEDLLADRLAAVAAVAGLFVATAVRSYAASARVPDYDLAISADVMFTTALQGFMSTDPVSTLRMTKPQGGKH